MTRLRPSVLALALAALLAPGSICRAAADTPPLIGPLTPLADPLAPVSRLGAIYRRTNGVYFSSTLDYTTTNHNTGKPETKHLDVIGEFSKPSQFYYKPAKSGAIISDGQWTIAEDASLTHYCRYPALHGFELGNNWAFVSSHVMHGNSELLNYSMVGYLFEHVSDRDFFHPQNMTIIGRSTTLNGKPIEDVEYKDAAADVHLYFDAGTGNPVGSDSTYFIGASQTFEVREAITKLTLLTTTLPAADFSTMSPPGAILVPIPVPKVRTTTRPKATTPRPPRVRQKQWRNVHGIWIYE